MMTKSGCHDQPVVLSHEQERGLLMRWRRFNFISIGVPQLLASLTLIFGSIYLLYYEILAILLFIGFLNCVFNRKRICSSIQLHDGGFEILYGMSKKAYSYSEIKDIKHYNATIRLWHFIKLGSICILEIMMPDEKQYTFAENQFGDLSVLADALRQAYAASVFEPLMQKLYQMEKVHITFGKGLELTRKGISCEGGYLPFKNACCSYDENGWLEIKCKDGQNPEQLWLLLNPGMFINTHMLYLIINNYKDCLSSLGISA